MSPQKAHHLVHQSHFVPGWAQFAPACRSADGGGGAGMGLWWGRMGHGARSQVLAPGSHRVGTFWRPILGSVSLCRSCSQEASRKEVPRSQLPGCTQGHRPRKWLPDGDGRPWAHTQAPAQVPQNHFAPRLISRQSFQRQGGLSKSKLEHNTPGVQPSRTFYQVQNPGSPCCSQPPPHASSPNPKGLLCPLWRHHAWNTPRPQLNHHLLW